MLNNLVERLNPFKISFREALIAFNDCPIDAKNIIRIKPSNLEGWWDMEFVSNKNGVSETLTDYVFGLDCACAKEQEWLKGETKE